MRYIYFNDVQKLIGSITPGIRNKRNYGEKVSRQTVYSQIVEHGWRTIRLEGKRFVSLDNIYESMPGLKTIELKTLDINNILELGNAKADAEPETSDDKIVQNSPELG